MKIAKIDKSKAFRNKVLDILTSSEYLGLSEELRAGKLGITRETLRNYKRREDVKKEVDVILQDYRTEAMKRSRQNTPKLLDRLDEQADGGNVAAIKLHLQVHGDLKEQIQHSGEIKSPAEEVQEEEHVKEMMGFLGSKHSTDSEQETAQ